jgi:hypothetical protein
MNSRPGRSGRIRALLAGIAAFTTILTSIGIAVPSAVSQSSKSESEISRALSAAPAAIAAHASVVILGDQGRKEELRAGTNGWTCIARDMNAPDDGIAHHPACFDKYGLEWIENYEEGASPIRTMSVTLTCWKADRRGATRIPTKPAPGQKDYIRIPAHIMILNAHVANSSGFPSGQTDPDTHKPFVMFGGTPFAILIIPVK